MHWITMHWIIVAYGLIGAIIGRWAGGWAAWDNWKDASKRHHERNLGLDASDLTTGFFAWLICLPLWPIVVIIWGMHHKGEAFLHQPPEVKATVEALKTKREYELKLEEQRRLNREIEQQKYELRSGDVVDDKPFWDA